ncbi:hypothetical protein [Limnobacter sp.]|uniref:hypothetical protein n=1 Tax=Limnobacter sp. TaxID=2003368 RepID=UPI0025C478A0|nr:hypothetical protein [Limnobacter sp.]
MAFYTGRNGSIKIGTSVVEKVRDWSLETTVELLSTNTIDSGVNTFVPGVKGATGSATLLYYQGTGTDFTALLSKIQKTSEITTSDKVTLTLRVDDSGTNSITFDAYITSATVSVSSGELTVVPFNFTVDGEFDTVIS